MCLLCLHGSRFEGFRLESLGPCDDFLSLHSRGYGAVWPLAEKRLPFFRILPKSRLPKMGTCQEPRCIRNGMARRYKQTGKECLAESLDKLLSHRPISASLNT